MKVLHVGCGPKLDKLHGYFRRRGWEEIRLDIDPACRPDIVASITDMPAVASESMDAVYSSHNLEHLEAHEVPLALREFRRVLKPDAFLLITMPDMQSIAQLVVDGKLDVPAYVSPAGPISPVDMIWGFRPSIAAGNRFMAHRTGFTAQTLTQALAKAGFQHVATARVLPTSCELWALAFTYGPSQEQVLAMTNELFPRKKPA